MYSFLRLSPHRLHNSDPCIRFFGRRVEDHKSTGVADEDGSEERGWQETVYIRRWDLPSRHEDREVVEDLVSQSKEPCRLRIDKAASSEDSPLGMAVGPTRD